MGVPRPQTLGKPAIVDEEAVKFKRGAVKGKAFDEPGAPPYT